MKININKLLTSNGYILTKKGLVREKKYVPKKSPRGYRKCVGCGNCVDVTVSVGKCEMCGTQKWIDCVENFY